MGENGHGSHRAWPAYRRGRRVGENDSFSCMRPRLSRRGRARGGERCERFRPGRVAGRGPARQTSISRQRRRRGRAREEGEGGALPEKREASSAREDRESGVAARGRGGSHGGLGGGPGSAQDRHGLVGAGEFHARGVDRLQLSPGPTRPGRGRRRWRPWSVRGACGTSGPVPGGGRTRRRA